MLDEIVKVLEVKDEDSTNVAMVKSITKGVVEGALLVGASHILHGIFGSKKK